MALGWLMILTVTISLLAIVGIILMVTVKNEKYVNVVFVVNAIYSLILTYLHATSLPTNFHLHITIAYYRWSLWNVLFMKIIASKKLILTCSRTT